MHRSGILVGLTALIGGALAGCSTSEVLVAHAIDLVPAKDIVPERQRLDIAIPTLDPGVPEGEIGRAEQEALLEDGIFVHIRRAESVHMAVQLRDTLQESGHWGGVWVTPEASTAADVNVIARIRQSDGDIVRVDVTAVDATGRTWLDKPYELETPAGVYNSQRYPHLDPYQDLFNSIANDLAAARAALTPAETREIRTVGALRYASELSPAAFGGYVARDGNRYQPLRLPALEDPIFERTRSVRTRERLFLETLNQHYDAFSSRASESYDRWREHAREEAFAMRELARRARWQRALGMASMVVSLASILNGGGNVDSFANRVVRDGMMSLSVGMLESAAMQREGKRLHRATLEELSASFDEEVTPLVVEIAGVQHRLTGTAEVQYAEWRNLLRQIFLDEQDLAAGNVDIRTGPEPPGGDETGDAPAPRPPAGRAPRPHRTAPDGRQ